MENKQPMICDTPRAINRSPLRYPGGKSSLFQYFCELINQNGLNGGKYYEPFAGGAGVALGLVSSNVASEAMLNDADYHIYCFWTSVLNDNEHFVERTHKAALSIKEWHCQKAIYEEPRKYSTFEVGFSTFYLNRCNRSGILAGAGPIGGYQQTGQWKLDARFNKEELMARISDIGELRDRISIDNADAIVFLKECLPRGRGRENVFVYLDPPYVSAGGRLYLNLYGEGDHKKLASYLIARANLRWVVTYDDTPLVRGLYSSCQRWLFHLGYSLQLKQKGKELLIAPEWLQLPNKNKSASARWRIVGKIKEN